MIEKKNLKKYTGSVIKKLREGKNMSQDDLAEKLNTTRQTISRYENGNRGINQELLFQLATIFDVSINEFFPALNNCSEEQEMTKEEKFELLKNILKRKGFLDESGRLNEENYEYLIEFAKSNRSFVTRDIDNK